MYGAFERLCVLILELFYNKVFFSMSKKKQKSSVGGKRNSLIIIICILVAVIACGLAGYVLYEMKNMQFHMASSKELTKKPAAEVVPMYVPLETFTVSLKPTENENDRVLYIGLTLRVKDEASKRVVEKYMPEVRSRLLFLFAQKTAADLSSDEGRTELIRDIMKNLGVQFAPGQNATVADVLFNAFILR